MILSNEEICLGYCSLLDGRRESKMECIKKRLLQINFILYIIFILYITLFSRNIGNGFAWENGKFEYYLSNSVNLIPFKSINHIFRYFYLSWIIF